MNHPVTHIYLQFMLEVESSIDTDHTNRPGPSSEQSTAQRSH
jgi:hypothetical protein